jgi:hypothetical protein
VEENLVAEFRIRKNSRGRYSVQRLIGYTDGRPSWGRTSLCSFITRNGAAEEITRLRLSVLRDSLELESPASVDAVDPADDLGQKGPRA